MPDPVPPTIDPTVPQQGNRDGSEGHYSGQEAGSFASPTPGTVVASAVRGGMPAPPGPADRADEDLPPDVGHRARVDQRTGEVHGSGAGAGGTGRQGEDYDSDSGGSNAAG